MMPPLRVDWVGGGGDYMSQYEPPITLTPELVTLTTNIAEQLGCITKRKSQAQTLRLRRISRLQTIQGSLAIEGNSLSVEQITAVIEGKPVIAPPREVQEVKNALAVYENFEQFEPLNEQDLLKAHKTLMLGLMDEAGHYRSGGVGVMSGKQVIHMAPPANQVPRLVQDLFIWLKRTKHHPLIATAIFHYEFEFIHPFADGNGRMGRLWQSVILAKWNPLFAHFPIESLVHAHQEDYYHAIAHSTAETDSGIFAEFMLRMIQKTLAQQLELQAQNEDEAAPRLELQLELRLESNLAAKVIIFLSEQELGKAEIAQRLGHKSVSGELNKQIKNLLKQQLIERTIPDKPTSSKQKYRLTVKAKDLLNEILNG